jgi:hypothetical protein
MPVGGELAHRDSEAGEGRPVHLDVRRGFPAGHRADEQAVALQPSRDLTEDRAVARAVLVPPDDDDGTGLRHGCRLAPR